jgi:hypothetical protein
MQAEISAQIASTASLWLPNRWLLSEFKYNFSDLDSTVAWESKGIANQPTQ